MPLQIEKHAAHKFTAIWSDREGRVIKRMDEPVDEKELLDLLTQAGCHPTDVYDALESVDPKLTSETERMKSQLDELIRSGSYKPEK